MYPSFMVNSRRLGAGVGRIFPAVLALLFVTGWAANHFAAVMPVLIVEEGLSRAFLSVVFGVYALGLLPGLLGGGMLADRLGNRAVALAGAAVVLSGTASMAFEHGPAGLLVGRLAVGVGAGLVMVAGTAWAGSLNETSGTTSAGVALTAGFAVGPVISGGLVELGLHVTHVAFLLSAVSICCMLVVTAVASRHRSSPYPVTVGDASDDRTSDQDRPVTVALAYALPQALWIFSCATAVFVVLPTRLPDTALSPSMTTGLAAALCLGSAMIVQTVARVLDWGSWIGVVGPAAACVGMSVVGFGGASASFAELGVCGVLLGAAYGFCLRRGLLDISRYTRPHRRARALGVFYVVSYLGFGLPLLATQLDPDGNDPSVWVALAVLAGCTALCRWGMNYGQRRAERRTAASTASGAGISVREGRPSERLTCPSADSR
ncbi:hypothetical protein RhoFasB10_00733 [Rhodococcus sp. B10]|nr:hypothetical protein [Rhodococcus sp. B10]